MTLPDTGSERPGGLASETRRMTEHDTRHILGAGPRGRVVIALSAIIVIGVALFLWLT